MRTLTSMEREGVVLRSRGAGLDVRGVDKLRRTARSARAWRRALTPGQATGPPDFVIVGAQRCGTTSLFRYLTAHPDVRPALGKELQYFSLYHRRSVKWYRGHFPATGDEQATFEASPYYLFHPEVPARISDVLPQARFVALLRDPVSRAYSHYQHSVRRGVEPLSFVDAIDAEEERLRSARPGAFDARGGNNPMREHSYLARGRYVEQLERWYARIDRDRILVVRSEDFYCDPASTYGVILDFLGLRGHTPTFHRHAHVQQEPVSQLTDEVRSELSARFAPHNDRLATLLGWTETWPAHPAAPPVGAPALILSDDR